MYSMTYINNMVVCKQGVQDWKHFCKKNQYPRGKVLNFENWYNGEVSKIGHYFRKYLKMDANHQTMFS